MFLIKLTKSVEIGSVVYDTSNTFGGGCVSRFIELTRVRKIKLSSPDLSEMLSGILSEAPTLF